jgi:hypothetical protein
MKKFALLAVVALMGSFAQSAMAFEIEAQATVSSNIVTVTACNTEYNTVITCSVTAVGMTMMGPLSASGTFVLAPGQCDNAYVYDTLMYGFINGSGTAYCN